MASKGKNRQRAAKKPHKTSAKNGKVTRKISSIPDCRGKPWGLSGKPSRSTDQSINQSIELVYNRVHCFRKPFTMTIQTIGAYEAKTHLPQFLRQVQAGQTFDISVRGVTVARLVPVDALDQQRAEAVAKMRAFTHQQHDGGAGAHLDLAALIREGRA
jgi:antitoxin (DNA-binding transcriptional repressor) of toxin-antitoxin stability system